MTGSFASSAESETSSGASAPLSSRTGALSGVVVKETKDYFARLAAAGNEDEMAPHLPGDNWDIPPIDPLDDRLGAAN